MTHFVREVAVVTGAASGIGAATVHALVRDGFDVACVDRDARAVSARADEFGERARAFAVDLCDEAGVAETFRAIIRWRGWIDALATCAGVVDTTEWSALSAARILEVMQINVVGTFTPIREAATVMRPGSRICTVSSVAGIRGGGLAGTVAYAASKGGVIAMSKTLARELGPLGITVNCVAPAVIRTPMLDRTTEGSGELGRLHGMTVLKREGRAEEAADAIAWFLSGRASFATGTTLPIDGGLAML
ncbi:MULTISPECIES: SDR family NAD(P)-dependent oxidoreductase [unclassified Caballeronia]|uniref:SDR family NAD(P)-dependent oxidoreductase n=1 Tax=unclassified Caballeronia TaxID=2646786 RepID=UPI002859BACE|nr:MULTISPECIES: SDR family NAD(P)-dependent oxidoreductase [unclassified Caballeronia]MDR5752626.1 SDR family NAD(P)-dependent oxidoreductase [Caballeronia sp. LZ024]MDR5841615.1 SDR family NAD(P)-dependent oxidoreductase [Caballeronia sp. LZ031]